MNPLAKDADAMPNETREQRLRARWRKAAQHKPAKPKVHGAGNPMLTGAAKGMGGKARRLIARRGGFHDA